MALMRVVSALVVLVFGSVASLAAQVAYDATRHVYVIKVHNDAGQLVDVVVTPTNRVKLRLTSSVDAVGTSYTYRYAVAVEPASPEGTAYLRIPCPMEGRPYAFTAVDPGGPITSETSRFWLSPRGYECQFGVGVRPNESGEATATTTLLPGLGMLLVIGNVPGVTWPTSDPTEETVVLSHLADSLQGDGPRGVVHRLPAVLPTYFPAVASDRLAMPYILLDNLRRMCATSGWVKNAGLCNSLTAKLEAAAGAAERSAWPAWQGSMESFLSEVRAQEGKGLSPDAASLLRTLATGALAAPH